MVHASHDKGENGEAEKKQVAGALDLSPDKKLQVADSFARERRSHASLQNIVLRSVSESSLSDMDK